MKDVSVVHAKPACFFVSLRPNASRSGILSFDKDECLFTVAVKSRPEKGRANAELVRMLSKHLGRKVEIISGFTSRRKKVRVTD